MAEKAPLAILISAIANESQLSYPPGGVVEVAPTSGGSSGMVKVDSGEDVRDAPAESLTPPVVCPGVALSSMRRGQCGVILSTRLEPGEAAMLRAMGIRPRVRIKLCRAGDPFIVELCCGPGVGARVALHRMLADHVMIGSIPAC
ncbi:MAG: ferrous iron transport protein A [Phycisphaeraceae bacterium]|nr:ferrous iron transport protein A [Phycisphaeraceae bacterium]MCW5754046.1 ferrous iron transport protein A [Phycisphaeraceae bacterium]